MYTIVAPAKIRPNSDYHINVMLTNATKPVNIEVAIAGPISSDSADSSGSQQPPPFRIAKTMSASPTEATVIKLQVDKLPVNASYKLKVKGQSEELKIDKEATLKLEPKCLSIFVQTDKAIYKPGQVIKFRAILVNPSLVPNIAGTVEVRIKV